MACCIYWEYGAYQSKYLISYASVAIATVRSKLNDNTCTNNRDCKSGGGLPKQRHMFPV